MRGDMGPDMHGMMYGEPGMFDPQFGDGMRDGMQRRYSNEIGAPPSMNSFMAGGMQRGRYDRMQGGPTARHPRQAMQRGGAGSYD